MKWRAALALGAVALVPCGCRTRPPADVAGWIDGTVCYEIFVRSFRDTDGDGIGDLQGVIRSLDHINDGDPGSRTDLGAGCIWLMPISPSPSYHGYDITDYYAVDPEYGTEEDFLRLVQAAHQRGIRVLVDMVINHVSSEHPWFQDALRHSGSPYRAWFRWADQPGPPNEWGDNNWRPSSVRDEYFYGFFWHTMPDLNWDSPAVRAEMKRVATFWLEEMGADGLRLDAVRHLMEEDGRSTHVPRTHDMLREYGAHIRAVDPDAFTVGEVIGSTDELLAYYPDQLDAYFAFEVADAILGAVGSGSPDELLASVQRLQEAVPDHRWAPFLRNHDQTRTMTWLGGDVARAKLAATLLLSLPGIPFVYYGEEIGMTGDKPDPRLRTPMHWDRIAAAGFSQGTPWEPLAADSFSANVEVMDDDPSSLLNLYRELIHLRAANPALGAGDLIVLASNEASVAAYLRTRQEETALVVANLGEKEILDLRISSSAFVLPPGRYGARVLLGTSPSAGIVTEGSGTDLDIEADGRVRGYRPFPSLPPLSAYILELSRTP